MSIEGDEICKLATVSSMPEAEIIKSFLASHGIEALIPDSLTSTVAPHLTFGEGIRILVRRRDLSEAQELLAEAQNLA